MRSVAPLFSALLCLHRALSAGFAAAAPCGALGGRRGALHSSGDNDSNDNNNNNDNNTRPLVTVMAGSVRNAAVAGVFLQHSLL